jgi:hypothetical protein
MKSYYTYVYYDADWVAYYVGKGQADRKERKRKGVAVPPLEHIQLFTFDHDWQAFECEIELIAFWQRQQDGGTLKNLTLGGPGSRGLTISKQRRLDLSKRMKNNSFNAGSKRSDETKDKMSKNSGKAKPITLISLTTGEIKSFKSRSQAAKFIKGDRSAVSKLVNGKYKSHKGWKLND